MSSSLIARYTYGNRLPDLVIHHIGVTKELQSLAKEQIKIQKTTSEEITRRNVEGAQIISSEIDQQTHKLERAMERFASNVSASVLLAADQISDAIDILGDHICADLDEIKWQLAQQNEVLDQILRVLRQSRSNEANQLVQQGTRLYINAEYEDAEERFRLALELDKTDYHVLMNLGFIEIRKDNAAAAHAFFKKAFSLPGNINSVCQAKTLRAIARLYYTEQTKQGYKNASSHAEQALKRNAVNDGEDVFRAGVYAALAGDISLALKRIEEAITLNPALFAIAAVEPDLQPIRKDVLALLSNISIAAKNKAAQLLVDVRKELAASSSHKEHKQCSDLISLVEGHLMKTETLLHKPSYSDCLDTLRNLEILRDVAQEISSLSNYYTERQQLQTQLGKAEQQRSKCEADKSSVPDIPLPSTNSGAGVLMSLALLIGYFYVGYTLASQTDDAFNYWSLLLAWPVAIAIVLLALTLDVLIGSGELKIDSEGWLVIRTILSGLIPPAMVLGIITLVNNTNKARYSKVQRRLEELGDKLAKLSAELTSTRNSLGAVDREISGYRDRITQKINELNWK